MKYCEEYAALLDAFIDGECSETEAARVREHLAECGGCSAYVQDALLLRSAFPDAEDTEVPGGFAEGVMAAIRVDAAPQRHRGGQWKKALVPLAACLAIVVAVGQLPKSGSTAASAPAASAPAMAAAENAEEGNGLARDTQDNASDDESASMQFSVTTAGDDPESGSGNQEKAAASASLALDESSFARRGEVSLTAEQTERLLAEYEGAPSLSGDGDYVLYTLTETEFAALLDALAAEDVAVVCTELDGQPGLCALVVYPAQ